MSGAAASGPSGSSVTLRATFGAVQAAHFTAFATMCRFVALRVGVYPNASGPREMCVAACSMLPS